MFKFSMQTVISSVGLIFLCSCLHLGGSEKQSLHMKNISSTEGVVPIVVLGGGVAGLTASLYLAQANIPCTLIEGPKPGGALAQSHSVRNWPGEVDAPGADIVQKIKKQAQENGVTVVQESVVSVDFSSWPYLIKSQQDGVSDIKQYRALSCVVAMGTEPNYLGIPGETGPDGYWGRSVSNCAVCEGSLFKDQSVIVVGGGDAAIVEAGYLADIARDVTIVVRKNHFRAKDLKARDRVLAKPNVKVFFESRIIKIQGDGTRVTSVVIERVDTGEYKNHPVDGVFLAIGSRPNTALFKDQLACDERGFLILQEHQATSKSGVFAAGDVCDDVFVQAITSAGQGCMAALQAKKFLEEVGFDAASGGALQPPAATPAKISKQNKEDVPQVKLEPEIAVIELSSMTDIKENVLGSKLPVVIDFYSTWCIPCQQMAPIFEELAKNLEGRVVFAKMNLGNKSLDLPAICNLIGGQMISSVPAFVFVRDGKEIGRKIGKTGRQDFEKLIMKTFGLID